MSVHGPSRAATWLLAAVLAAVSCGCTETAPTATKDAPAATESAAASNKLGPKPVVVGGPEFDFGVTEMGQEFEHTFVVRNAGDEDLVCKAGAPSCTTCTSFTIDREVVPPGETLNAHVKWHIKVENPEFRQYAPIMWGEDQELRLFVVGRVSKRIVLSPIQKWHMGDVVDGQTATFKATLTSALVDTLEIESIKYDSPSLKVTSTPMTAERLKETKAKVGYELLATLDSNIPVGEFKDRVTINVLAPKLVPLSVDVEARRTGPVKIIGPNWNDDLSILRLGDIDPTKDYVTKLNVFVRGVDEEMKLEKVESADKRLTAELKLDPKFKGTMGSRRYELFIKFKSDNRPVVYTRTEPLDVELHTNLPSVKSIKFKIRSVE